MIKQFIVSFMAISILSQTTFLPFSHAYASNSHLKNSSKSSLIKINKNEIIKKAYQDFKKDLDLQLVSVEKASEKFSLAMFAHNVNEDDMANFVEEYAEFEDYLTYLESIETAKLDLAGEEFTPEEFSQIAASSLMTLDQESLRWSGCASLGVGIVLLIGAVTMGIIALTKSKGEAKIRDIFAEKEQNLVNSHDGNVYFIENHETEIPRRIRNHENNIISKENAIDNAEDDIRYLQGQLHSGLTDEERSDIESDISSLRSDISSYESSISHSYSRISWLENEAINYEIIPGWEQQQLDIEELRHRLALESNAVALQARIDAIPEEHRQARILGVAAGISVIIGTILTINGAQDC
jgi:hypothetical protein